MLRCNILSAVTLLTALFGLVQGAEVRVVVRNARNGNAVEGVECSLFSGKYGTLYSTTLSDSAGVCSINILTPSRKATLEVRLEHADYYAVARQFTGADVLDQNEVAVQVNPKIDPSTIPQFGGYRVVLSWGNYVSDLDSYLLDPDGCTVSYQRPTCDRSTQGSANLDVDDTDYYGPETVYISNAQSGVYAYMVNIYTSGVCFDDGIKANVKIWSERDGGLLHDLNVPKENPAPKCLGQTQQQACKSFWHVADYNANTQQWTIVNQFLSQSEYSTFSPNQASSSLGSSASCTCQVGSNAVNSETATVFATKISEGLPELDADMCGTTFEQHLADTTYNGKTRTSDSFHNEFLNKIKATWNKRVGIVKELQQDVKDSLGSDGEEIVECCEICNACVFDSQFGAMIDKGTGCARYSGAEDAASQSAGFKALRHAGSKWEGLHKEDSTLKWAFAADLESGTYVSHPRLSLSSSAGCGGFDPRMRPWMSEAVSGSKRIVIVLDMTADNRAAAKQGILNILRTVSASDRINIVLAGANGEVQTVSSRVIVPVQPSDLFQSCQGTGLLQGTTTNLKILQKFVEEASPFGTQGAPSSYEHALSTAKSMMTTDQTSNNWPVSQFDTDVVILLAASSTSSSSSSSIASAMPTGAKLVVFPFGPSSDSIRTFFCALSNTFCGEPSQNIATGPATYYAHQLAAINSTGKPLATALYFDASGLGMVTSLVAPVFDTAGELTVVVGVDVTVAEMADVLETDLEHSYAALVDETGLVVSHPLLPRPKDHLHEPQPIHLSDLEPEVADFVLAKIKAGESGSLSRATQATQARGDAAYDGFSTRTLTKGYRWSNIPDSRFWLLSALEESEAANRELVFPVPLDTGALVPRYHRWKLVEEAPTRTLGDLQVLDGESAVFVAARGTDDPPRWVSLAHNEAQVARDFPDLMGDSNPGEDLELTGGVGLLPQTFNDVRVSQFLNKCWADQGVEPQVVWRYWASPRGVFRMMPGYQWSRNFDPTTRPWYLQAKANGPEVHTFSTPYVDGGGAGEVVTVARAVRGEAAQSGVVAIDLTVGGLKTFLEGRVPECASQDVRCVLMNLSGYLVYHPDFNGASGVPREHVFLAEKHAEIASVMVARGMLTRRSCADLITESQRTMYRFNETSAGGLEPLTCGSFVAKRVPGANLVLVAVNGNGCSNPAAYNCQPCNPANCQASLSAPGLLCQPCSCQVFFDACSSSFSGASGAVCPRPIPPQELGVGACDPLDADWSLTDLVQDVLKSVFRYLGFVGFCLISTCITVCRLKKRSRMQVHVNTANKPPATPVAQTATPTHQQVPVANVQHPQAVVVQQPQAVAVQHPQAVVVQQPMMMAQQPQAVVVQQPMMMVQQQPMMVQQQPMMVQQQPMMVQQQPMMVQQTNVQQGY